MTKFEAGKEYLTRDGRDAYIWKITGRGSLDGFLQSENYTWTRVLWQSSGQISDYCGCGLDLMQPKPNLGALIAEAKSYTDMLQTMDQFGMRAFPAAMLISLIERLSSALEAK